MNGLEALVGAVMIGTAVWMVVSSVLAVGLRLWVQRQPVATQARVRERMTRFTDQSLKVLDGTVSAFAIVLVSSFLVALVGAVLVVALTLVR